MLPYFHKKKKNQLKILTGAHKLLQMIIQSQYMDNLKCQHNKNTTVVTDLCKVNGEDGVRAAAGVIHAGAGRGAVDVSRLHQLLHVRVVLNQVL